MLTVDFDRLGLRGGERVLDMGCGAGRHAFECLRRGAAVVALDADEVELKGAVSVMAAMAEAGEVREGGAGLAVRGTALDLPFPDGSFDRVIAAEVLEHIPDDVRAMAELARVVRPGGRLAVTVPRYLPELVNWALSSEYHETPGGHVRIYRRPQLVSRLEAAGLRYLGHGHVHGLHSPYWWLKCLVGVGNEGHPLVRAYHRVLVHDIVHASAWTRVPERVLAPVVGKSLVVYLERV
ncbi:MAG TPA: class I SAM-dependent methyltransferase [Acidimicrobiales bacterium]|nr:class I SAM-dependent methyltransferase [Acidimicrobiales bacterium]